MEELFQESGLVRRDGYGRQATPRSLRDEDDEETSLVDLDEEEYKFEKEIQFYPESPDEGIYGMAVASLIIDSRMIAKTTGWHQLRHIARLLLSLALVFFTLGLQLYVTVETKFIVTPHAVKEIREAYSNYQMHMYSETQINEFGNYRGIPSSFNESKFSTLPKDQQTAICTFPLSQPTFLGAILLIWTMTCLRYMRKIATFTRRLWVVPCDVSSMADPEVFQALDEESDDKLPTRKVLNMTWCVKLFAILAIQMPAFVLNIVLLWIGCRWLVATLGFGEVLLNAIALEFILVLHEILFHASVPYSMKQELNTIAFDAPTRSEEPNCCNMFGTFITVVVGIAFTTLYISHFQQVLPDYNWDVHGPCSDFLTVKVATHV